MKIIFRFKIGRVNIPEWWVNIKRNDGSTCSGIYNKEGEDFKYEYDFGDGWYHTIILEEYESIESTQQLPFCLSGALKCPPEDCGGITGFYDFLSIMSNKRHPDYRDTKIWAGGKFDATEFDLVKINKQLKKIDKYIKSIEE